MDDDELVDDRIFKTAFSEEDDSTVGASPTGKGRYLSASLSNPRFVRTPSRKDFIDEEAREALMRMPFKSLAEEIYQRNPNLIIELNRIATGTKDKPRIKKKVAVINIHNEKDYDTDLEIDEDDCIEDDYTKAERNDTSGSLLYMRMCEEMGVIPVQYFLRHFDEPNFVMKYHGLGSDGAKALSIPLEKNTKIIKLGLEGNDIGSEGAIALSTMLTENMYLTELNLAENNIGSAGAARLADVLDSNNRIATLDLSGNSLNDHDAECLCEMLQHNTAMHNLYLGYNKFTDKSSAYFKEALYNNDTLQLLDLRWNIFRSQGATAIADGLKENSGLKILNVSMNGFGAEGAKSLGNCLLYNRTLMELDVTSNRIPLAGTLLLAKGLHVNDVITVLKIGHNPLTAAGALCILSAISTNENSTLNWIDFSEVYVNTEFLELKEKMVESRKHLVIIHGMMEAEVIKKKPSKTEQKNILRQKLLSNPITKMKDFMNKNGLRLIDFFKNFDRDQSMTLSRDEFRRGCRMFKIDMTDEDIDRAVTILDTDKSGDVDFHEFVQGDKEYMILRRALLAEIDALDVVELAAANKSVDDELADVNKMSKEEAYEAVEEVIRTYYNTTSDEDMNGNVAETK